MNKVSTKRYPAKILLFGEYTVVRGAQALAMPLSQFGGEWKFADDLSTKKSLQYDLPDFVTQIEALQGDELLLFETDVEKLWDDVEQGIYFHSNIPMGYGLGSSGALCAAIYERFAKRIVEPSDEDNILQLKKIFSQIENFFHGSSSGLDPLICYLHKTLLLEKEKVQIIDKILACESDNIQLFLLDTDQARETAPLVDQFLADCEKEPHYADRIDTELTPLNEEAIQHFCQQDWPELWKTMHAISHFQFKYFSNMIPDNIRTAWLDGLNGQTYKLKLCGAGGGGFMLGISKDIELTAIEVSPLKIIPLA